MKWNIVFLVDQNPLNKVIFLKRAANKTFAANFYTGVGGKVEEGEELLKSTYRELKEETGLEGIELKEFARAIILNANESLHYFWGIYQANSLPKSDDGVLEWVSKDNLLAKKIIPSTVKVVEEWKKRDFSLIDLFTVYLTEIRTEKTVKKVKLVRITSGLKEC